jgi:hypothetical protein
MIADMLMAASGQPAWVVVLGEVAFVLVLVVVSMHALERLLRAPAGYTPTIPAAPERQQRPPSGPPVIVLPTLHGRCKWCGRLAALRTDGRIDEHKAELTGVRCDGSLTVPGGIEGVRS